MNQGLKRKINERDSSRDGQELHYSWKVNGERPLKQASRRIGKDLQRSHDPRNSVASGDRPPFPRQNPAASMANNIPPAGVPPFNPADPMAFFALAALGLQFPGLPPLPFPGLPLPLGSTGADGQTYMPMRKGRCKDYDTKGFCALGSVCPFEHGGAVLSSSIEGKVIDSLI